MQQRKFIYVFLALQLNIQVLWYDTPNIKDLIAANHTTEEIRKIIGVNTLQFLSIDGLYRALGFEKRDNQNPQFTDHCFTGDYPVQPVDQLNQFEKNNQLSLLSNVRL